MALPPTPTVSARFGPRHRWIVLAVGTAAQASFAATFAGIPVTGTTLRAQYGLSTGSLGLVLGCVALGIAVSEIAWGLWTDRFGERRVLLTGLVSTGALLALMAAAVVPLGGAAPPLAVLAGSLLLVGFMGGSVNGSSGRAVMAWFPEGRRGFAMSIRQTAIPAGGAVGAALLPWLAVHHGFRPVFAVLAAFCFITAAATWRWLHQPGPGPVPAASGMPGEPGTRPVSPLRRADVWRLALASGLLTVPQFATLTFAAVFLHDAKGASVAVGAVTLLTVQVGGAAARIWSGRFTDRRGDRRGYVRAASVVTAAAFAGAALLTGAPTLVIALALAAGGLLANAWHGVAYTEIAAMAGADRAGTALGLENTTVFTAAFLTPLAIPAVLEYSSWSAVWAATAALTLLALPLAPRRAARRSGAAPGPQPAHAHPAQHVQPSRQVTTS